MFFKFKCLKYMRVVFLAVAIMAVGTGCGFNEKESYDKAQQYYNKGNYNAAVIELKKILKNNTENKSARVLLAKSYLELEQGASAEKELRFAVKAGVPRGDVVHLLAESLLKQKKFDEVINDIPITADISDKNKSELILSHAFAYLAKNNTSKAKLLFEKIRDAGLNPSMANVGLAMVAMKGNDMVLANAYIEKALHDDAKNSLAWLTQGQIHLQKNNITKAREAFEKVIALSEYKKKLSQEFKARVYLVQLALSEKNNERIKSTIKDLHDAVPNHPLSLYYTAMLAYQSKDYDKARSLLEKILVIVPDDLQSKLLLGAVLFAQGKYELANKYLAVYVENVPTNLQARKLLAATQVKLGYGDQAFDSLKSALDTNQNDSDLLAMIGKTAMYSSHGDKAIGYLQQAKKAKPASSQIRTELARAYMMKGDYEDAIDELKSLTGKSAKQTRLMLVYAHLQNKDIKAARNLSEQIIRDIPDNPMPYVIAGAVEMAAGNRIKASAQYHQALEKDGTFIPALSALARLAYEDKKFDVAESYYTRILNKDSANEKAYVGMAMIAEQKGDTEKSISYLQQSLDRQPAALVSGMTLGRYYLKNKKYDKGLKIISQLAERHSDKPKVISVLVQAQLISGKKQDALATAKSMTEKWRDLPIGYIEQARVQTVLEQYGRAERSLNSALKIKPDLLPAKTGLVSVYLKSGDTDKALAYAKNIQKQHPKLVIGYMLVGQIYMTTKKYKLAQNEYQQAYSIQKSSAVVGRLSSAYQKSGLTQKAVKTLKDWLKDNPSDAKVRMQLAGVYSQLKDNTKAIAEYEILLKDKPDNIILLNNLAVLYMETDIRKSSEYSAKAYHVGPSIVPIADTYAWILYKTGKTAEALPILEKAVSKTKHPSIHYHYAEVLAKSGKTREAKAILDRIIKMDFDEIDAAKKLYKTL